MDLHVAVALLVYDLSRQGAVPEATVRCDQRGGILPAAQALFLPVALVVAPYLGVAGEVIFFSALMTAGMPFLLLIGAAPNAIAYNSKQFTTGEFFKFGIAASIMLMVVVYLAVAFIWPLMGMEVFLK